MINTRIDTFIKECNAQGGSIKISYEPVAPSIRFSNSGRRGLKYFSISLADLISTFEDIKKNIKDYESCPNYSQDTHRTLFYSLSSPIASALGGTQTMPFFNLLAKIIHKANQLTVPFIENRMSITESIIDNVLTYLKSQLPDNTLYLNNLITPATPIFDSKDAVNIIYYGAPGTGKSYTINEKTIGYKKTTTVFHSDTQYSDFVGSLKPKMEEDPSDSSKRQITYQFRPGPFTKALIEAIAFSNEHVYLIIEEINRAPAAAVFGELFQLLDRLNGASKYEIDAADPDMLDYINSQLPADKVITKLSIPANLSLLATMNSSDQAVMPMDTAFKRRWSFRYIKIDFDNVDVPNNKFRIPTIDGVYDISWSNFAQIINKTLIECHVAEDRLLGPFFLNENEMADEEATKETLSGKLFVYLWDDVLRHLGHTKIFSPSYKTFGDLSNAFHEGLPIFNTQVEDAIKANGNEVIIENSQGEIISE